MKSGVDEERLGVNTRPQPISFLIKLNKTIYISHISAYGVQKGKRTEVSMNFPFGITFKYLAQCSVWHDTTLFSLNLLHLRGSKSVLEHLTWC